MEWNLERCCKINNNDLRFRVGEIVSLWGEEFVSWWGLEFISWWGLEFVSWWVCEIVSWRVCKFMGSWAYKLMGSWVCKLMSWCIRELDFRVFISRWVALFYASHTRGICYLMLALQKMTNRLWHDICLFIVPFRTTLFSETSKWAIGFKQHTQTFLLTLACKSALFLLPLYCLIITCNTDEKV